MEGDAPKSSSLDFATVLWPYGQLVEVHHSGLTASEKTEIPDD